MALRNTSTAVELAGAVFNEDFSKSHAESLAARSRNERITAILARQRRLEQELAEVKRLLNGEALVNTLPEELLAEVFYYIGRYSTPMAEGPDARDWSVVRLVCHHWDTVIYTTPRFWRRIRVQRSMRWLALCLSRSHNATVSISYNFRTYPTFPSPDCHLSEVLIPHIARVYALQILGFDAHRARLTSNLWQSMPSLRELSLRRESIGTKVTSLCILPATLSRLQVLSICCPVDIQGIDQCRELRKLTLQHIPASSLDSLIVLLSTNRSIREVDVRDDKRSDEMPITMPAHTDDTVILPELRILRLVTSSRTLASAILRRYRFPAATEIKITLKARGLRLRASGAQFLHAILLPEMLSFDMIFPMFRRTTDLVLFCDHDDASLLATGTGYRMSIAIVDIGSAVSQVPLADILKMLPAAPVSTVSIDASFADYPHDLYQPLWEAFFAATPHLETLALTGCGADECVWNGLLNTSIAARNMANQCCPRLHTVSVDDELISPPYLLRDVVSSMIEALRYRNERGLRLARLEFQVQDEDRDSNGAEAEKQYSQVLGGLVGGLSFFVFK
ncbi:hypothetical protein OH76DRAFT_1407507 [Lentinus brumalis]|uniref:F-box domain-containing protein n=1 Tax=Lentinus brumalis TaxID=2498619 RepID=A0A371D056_9APHY|nr:hypothetical protein OH76DRAFT_1407507 [Polyporus brumalis]